MTESIIIAGKNNIAADVLEFIRINYSDLKIYAIFNENDSSKDTFQKSFRKKCALLEIPEIKLEDAQNFENALFLSLEFDKIIKPEKFKTKKLFNIHFSYLPSYKGMYTSALPIIFGEKFTGVTLHRIDAGIDTGDIIDQVKFEIGNTTTGQELYTKYIKYGTAIVLKNLNELIADNYSAKPQPVENSSYYSKKALDYSNITIDYNKTATEIYNQIRAFSFPAYQLPEYKGTKVYHSEILTKKSLGKSGTIMSEDEFFIEINTIDYNLRLKKDRRQELFDACKTGDMATVKNFILNDYDIRQKSPEGWDALILAAYNGRNELAKFLIEEIGWDIRTQNNNGTNFLMYVMTNASNANDTALLEYVLRSFPEIDLKHTDNNGKDILHYAQQLNNPKVLALL